MALAMLMIVHADEILDVLLQKSDKLMTLLAARGIGNENFCKFTR